MQQAQKFAAYTDFSRTSDRQQPARGKTRFTAQEVEAIRQEAFADGRQSLEAQAAQSAAESFQTIAELCVRLLGQLAAAAHGHKQHAVQMAQMIADKIAGAAIGKFPEDQVLKIIEDHIALICDAPKVVIQVAAPLADSLKENVLTLAAGHGIQTQIEILEAGDLTGADCRLAWTNGGLEHNAERIARDIEAAIADQLIADRLSGQQLDLFEKTND